MLAIGLATFAAPAQAITINAIYDSSITNDPNAAPIEATINQAISFYQSVITTNITVNIGFAEMTSGLGQSSTYYSGVSYAAFLAALAASSSGDATDTAALASLPSGINNPNDPNNPVNNTGIAATTANLRALGFSSILPPTDSNISINTGITNYTGKTYNSGYYSLLAVVEHEMDEALGVGSALNLGNTTSPVWTEDLFRYSAPGVRSYTTAAGATAYFSVDGGVTPIAYFNQPGCSGCSDYNDWNGASLYVQNAYGTPGANPYLTISSPEMQVLDAIGYNLVDTPEPATLWMTGLGAAAFILRRRSLRRRSLRK